MERQEKIKRRDEVRALFEGKVYEGEFILEASMSIDGNTVYLCDIHMHDLTDFPYSEREEFAKKCYKEFPKNGFTLENAYDKNNSKLAHYVCSFHGCNHNYDNFPLVTLQELKDEAKRIIDLLY